MSITLETFNQMTIYDRFYYYLLTNQKGCISCNHFKNSKCISLGHLRRLTIGIENPIDFNEDMKEWSTHLEYIGSTCLDWELIAIDK